mgnify:CR=1 FL=1
MLAAESIRFPYREEAKAVEFDYDEFKAGLPHYWRFRTNRKNRLMFGKLPEESGLHWAEYRFFATERYVSQFLITFAEVATHNHFVLDRGGKLFKQTAPVIKLPAGSSEADHLGLLGLLNSSVACFWLKQVCHNKGSTVDQHGARQRTSPFEDFYALNSTKVAEFPLCPDRPLAVSRTLDTLAQQLTSVQPASLFTPKNIATSAGCIRARGRFGL